MIGLPLIEKTRIRQKVLLVGTQSRGWLTIYGFVGTQGFYSKKSPSMQLQTLMI